MRNRTLLVVLACATVGLPLAASRGEPAFALGSLGPTQRRCFAVAGSEGDAAIVNLTPVLADGPGNGQLVASDVASPPSASNVNFAPGSADPNVAVARIGPDGQVCFVNSPHTTVHLVADHLGTVVLARFQSATQQGTPDRRLDTRGGAKLAPGERRCFTVVGAAGDAALVNLTPVAAEGPGNGQLVSSDMSAPPAASNVNFALGSADPNVAVAPIGADGQVCFVNSPHTSVHLIADHLGTISGSGYERATAQGGPNRALDTRAVAKLGPGERRCFAVAGAPGDAAIVNLTPVLAEGPGNGQLVASDVGAAPAASNVNFAAGTADPNVAVAPIGPDGQVCFVNSPHTSVHLIADHLGTISGSSYRRANPQGSPNRALDTRTEVPPPPPPTVTLPPAPPTTTKPAGNCHPSYPTVCIPPPPPDLDCGDIPYRRFTVVGGDPHRFDADNDGIGCESG